MRGQNDRSSCLPEHFGIVGQMVESIRIDDHRDTACGDQATDQIPGSGMLSKSRADGQRTFVRQYLHDGIDARFTQNAAVLLRQRCRHCFEYHRFHYRVEAVGDCQGNQAGTGPQA